MVRIIDRFILSIFLKLFVVILFGVMLIIFIFEGLNQLLTISELKAALTESLKILPASIDFIGPYIALLATMLTYSSLYKNNEIMAMKSAGLHQLQIIRSIVLASLVIAAGLYFNQSYLVRLLNAEVKTISLAHSNKILDWYQLDNKLIKITNPNLIFSSIDEIKVIEYDLDNQNVSQEEYQQIRKINNHWISQSADFESFNADVVDSYTETMIGVDSIDFSKILNSPVYPSAYQTISQLYRSWQYSQRGQYVSRLSLLLMLRKISYPLGFLLLVLLTVTLSQSQPREQKNAIKIIAMTLIYYFYWFFDQMLFLLSKEGAINPFIGTFAISFLMLAFLFYYLKFRRG